MPVGQRFVQSAKDNIFAIGERLEVFEHGVPRTAQWLAFALLPIVIIANLAILTAVRAVLEGVMIQDQVGNGLTVFSFVITGIMLGLFAMSCWFWFFWVKTGGLKLLA